MNKYLGAALLLGAAAFVVAGSSKSKKKEKKEEEKPEPKVSADFNYLSIDEKYREQELEEEELEEEEIQAPSATEVVKLSYDEDEDEDDDEDDEDDENDEEIDLEEKCNRFLDLAWDESSSEFEELALSEKILPSMEGLLDSIRKTSGNLQLDPELKKQLMLAGLESIAPGCGWRFEEDEIFYGEGLQLTDKYSKILFDIDKFANELLSSAPEGA